MFKKILKWLGIIFAGFIVLAILATIFQSDEDAFSAAYKRNDISEMESILKKAPSLTFNGKNAEFFISETKKVLSDDFLTALKKGDLDGAEKIMDKGLLILKDGRATAKLYKEAEQVVELILKEKQKKAEAVKKAEERKANAIARAKEEAKIIKVKMNTILSAYQNNEIAADNKYKNEKIRVTGVISEIGKDMFDNIYITVGTGKEWEIPQVQAYFKNSEHKKVGELNKGSRITVTCQVVGLMMNVQTKNCVIK